MESAINKKEQEFLDGMKRCHDIEFARLGMMVEVDGHFGTIVGMNSSANLDVVFANRLKFGKHAYNCHPTWRTRYFDVDGQIVADFTNEDKHGGDHGTRT